MTAGRDLGPTSARLLRAAAGALDSPLTMIALGALVLLLPAIIYRRPFIYHDTWEFYGWGHDILAAVRHPWPSTGPFPSGRGLWVHQYIPSGTPQVVNEATFRLLMSELGARSLFYAVPLYVLRSLWTAVAVQAVAVSWTLWVAVSALGLRPKGRWHLASVTTLTVGTGLPFFVAFVMPDVFGGLLVLVLGLVLFVPDQLTRRQRWGLLALAFYSMVAHTSNVGLIALAVPAGALLMVGRRRPAGLVARRLRPIAGVLALGVLALAMGSQGLRAVFGRPVQNPPFILGRVIADGPGLAFLERHCGGDAYVACEIDDPGRFGLSGYRGSDLIFTETYGGPHPFSARTDPDQRARFYREASRIVTGAILEDPWGELSASVRNTLQQLTSFGLRDQFVWLPSMLSSGQVVGDRIASITPAVDACRRDGGNACGFYPQWFILDQWHCVVFALALLVLEFRLVVYLVGRPRRESLSAVESMSLFIMLMVMANAFIAGALSMPVDRLQGRVAWLIPFMALVVEGRVGRLRGLFPMKVSEG